MSESNYKHGDTTKICGTKCRFVAYEHDGYLDTYLADTDEKALGCHVCPADRTPECGKTRCYGGYWVPDPLFNVLRLRGMPGGDDGP